MSDEITVDKNKVENLIRKIVLLENNNLKTHQRSDAQMINEIQKVIEEVVDCYSNQ